MTDINALINAEDDKRQSKEQEEAALLKRLAEAGGMTTDELMMYGAENIQQKAKMNLGAKTMLWMQGYSILQVAPEREEELKEEQARIIEDVRKDAYGLTCAWGNDSNTTGLLTVDVLNILALMYSYLAASTIADPNAPETSREEWGKNLVATYRDTRGTEVFQTIESQFLDVVSTEHREEMDKYDKFRFDSHNLLATILRTEMLDFLQGSNRKDVEGYKNQYDAACYTINYMERVNENTYDILFGALIGFGQFLLEASTRYNVDGEALAKFCGDLLVDMATKGAAAHAAEEAKNQSS